LEGGIEDLDNGREEQRLESPVDFVGDTVEARSLAILGAAQGHLDVSKGEETVTCWSFS
jgi:hypothetical protein